MKIIQFIGHPVSVVIVFLLILISGQSFGGFYVVYLFMGLAYGAPHALIALIGLLLLLLGYKFKNSAGSVLTFLCYFLGITLMILALYVFFDRSKGYNDDTFHQLVPLASLGIFILCCFCCLFLSVLKLKKLPKENDGKLTIVS